MLRCFDRSNGTPAGNVLAAKIKENLEPITILEEVDGVEITSKPMDSCDAGQLEACAIERSALLALAEDMPEKLYQALNFGQHAMDPAHQVVTETGTYWLH